MNDKPLAQKLLRIVAIKLLVLFALWWAFFCQPGVAVDPSTMMTPVTQQPTQGETQHGQ